MSSLISLQTTGFIGLIHRIWGASLEKEKNCLCSNSQKDLVNPSKEVTVLIRILWNRGLPITP